MGCRAKAIQAKHLTIPCEGQRTPTDQTGAEQRRKCDVSASFAKRKRKAGISDGHRRETAIASISSEERSVAKVFLITEAIGTDATSMAKPRNADPLSDFKAFYACADGINPTDDFVSRNDWHFRIWQFTIHDVQVCSTNAAGRNLYSNLIWPRLRIGEFCPFQRNPYFIQYHRMHGVL